MNEQKDALRRKFSADFKKYYFVDLFRREGFVRKKCENCGRHFWTLDEKRTRCDDQPCSPYSFIGDPPAKKKLDYVETWRIVERFFKRDGHTSVKRYPVVARWRPDLYFTVASIIDFQRIEGGKVVFELPANPLVVPQMCLRFNDIPSVGVSGKHNTSFCMVGQTSIADRQGYWKDRCIDLDFALITKELGIPAREITFNEDVWLGYGAFGYSLEFFVRGLELGNAVFTAYEGTPDKYVEMKEKVVDMGAGLQRLTWMTQGTPTSYDSNFPYVLREMKKVCRLEYDRDLFLRYSKLAGVLNIDEFKSLTEARRLLAKQLGVGPAALTEEFGSLEAVYAIADHAQTLLFALADGMLPSNSGGGYNLRILYRRAMNFINQYHFPLKLQDVVNWHIDYLSKMYPELEEHRNDVAEILDVESSRYTSTTERVAKIVVSVASGGKSLSTEELVKLYDSDGVTPEQLHQASAKVSVPEDFYERVLARHSTRKVEEAKPAFDIDRLPATKLLYYQDPDKLEFKAKVLRVFDGKHVVLNQTAFYPRGGGQEPDHGTIAGATVTNVEKYGDIVIHKVEGKLPKASALVKCRVDGSRRTKITKIHTATHILNGSSRQILGPWVWQHSAFKEENYGRLDITHYAHLTHEQVQKIEDLANEVVRKDMQVDISFMQRTEAEKRYGFRLYQGGVVPAKMIRVVNIGGWDIEACGGTHTRRTGEVGFIKITKVERIQDGVERIEFVAGEPAMAYLHEMDSTLEALAAALGTQRENVAKVVNSLREELEASRARERALGEQLAEMSTAQILSSAKPVGSVRLYVGVNPPLAEDLIIAQGQKCVQSDPTLIYASLSTKGNSAKIICFVGSKARFAGASATEIVKRVSAILGGSGGGTPTFAQGGGPMAEKINEAAGSIESAISTILRN
ncbi:MAG: alanine--tRNA ligase [Thaumarchaeota archaeon]|nr:alanine--tRNA ligase [Nitrososphaerota archaeon]